jgi:hypothetical protein
VRDGRIGVVFLLASVSVLAAALAATLVLAAAGCGGYPAPSGISGLAVEEGGPVDTHRPFPAAQIEVRQGDRFGRVVTTVKSDIGGRFTVNLPPGRYALVPLLHGAEYGLVASATVVSGKFAHVLVTYAFF